MDNPFVSASVANPTAMDVQRRNELAKYLMQQGMAQTGTETAAGGVAVRKSPLEGLAKMLEEL